MTPNSLNLEHLSGVFIVFVCLSLCVLSISLLFSFYYAILRLNAPKKTKYKKKICKTFSTETSSSSIALLPDL